MKKLIPFFLVSFLFLIVGSAFALDVVQKRIEDKQGECVDKNPSTVGMVECAQAAYEEWDKELNRSYSKLMKQLPEEEKKTLRLSQRAWLKFRDHEYDNIANIYSHMEGTMYRPMHVESRTRILRERVLQLHKYLELMEDSNL